MEKQWSDFTRNDLNIIPIMLKNGWEVIFNEKDILCNRTTIENVPHNGVSFKKDNIHVWEIRNGWRVAKLANGYFTDHKTIDTPLNLIKK